MPTIRRETTLPDVLVEGDQITMTISHQTYVDGDQTWITYKVSSRVQQDEKFEVAHKRVKAAQTTGMADLVKETVRNARSGYGQEKE